MHFHPFANQSDGNNVAGLVAIKRHRQEIASELFVAHTSDLNEAITYRKGSEIVLTPVQV
jgi:hypothetical protein